VLLGTSWGIHLGTLWEPFGNMLGTHWEQGEKNKKIETSSIGNIVVENVDALLLCNLIVQLLYISMHS
jgi:hypothetical protein